jgi:hypothetical protein
MLVIYEAAGMSGEMATYLMRSLLSEGQIRYETVVKTEGGPKGLLIERQDRPADRHDDRVHLHPRERDALLSIPVTDTQEQTRSDLLGAGDRGEGAQFDLTPWHRAPGVARSGGARVTIRSPSSCRRRDGDRGGRACGATSGRC